MTYIIGKTTLGPRGRGGPKLPPGRAPHPPAPPTHQLITATPAMAFASRQAFGVTTDEAVATISSESGRPPQAAVPVMPTWLTVGLVGVIAYLAFKDGGS